MKKRNNLLYFVAFVLSTLLITSCCTAMKRPMNTLESTTITEPLGRPGADIEIGNISGGVGVTAEIINVGNETADANWSITVTVITGFILTGAITEGSGLEIAAGEMETVGSGIIIGLGSVQITVTAEIPGDSAEKTANGFVLILFLLNVG